jgi:hypothetical protein
VPPSPPGHSQHAIGTRAAGLPLVAVGSLLLDRRRVATTVSSGITNVGTGLFDVDSLVCRRHVVLSAPCRSMRSLTNPPGAATSYVLPS